MGERQAPKPWRAAGITLLALLCSLVLPGLASADPDDCSVSGGVATCSGNQSAGIRNGKDFGSGVTQLNVNELTEGIGPDLSGNTNSDGDEGGIILQYSGTDGDTPTTIFLNYDATNNGTSYEIHTTADGSAGIYIHNTSEHGGSGDIGDTGHHGKDAFSIIVTGEPLGFVDAGGFGSVGIELFTQAGDGGEGGADDAADGGDGGAGGLGGDIALEAGDATIHTTGTDGIGVSAISVGGGGGGGGDGGDHGGAGGTGGTGGTVSLDTQAEDSWTIETQGGGTSPAVVLQSIGGSGGDGKGGGNNGGHGGTGGDGGAVNLSAVERGTWTISTSGDSDSHGFSLLSQGGNAGHAGQGDADHGGTGGHGGQGGAISIGTLGGVGGSIATIGSQSHGIYAVSKAGAGGDGGAGETLGDGGNGGAGGGGGAITLMGDWTVSTSGTQSHGIAAYSLGAQGGNGGDSAAAKGGSGGDTGLSGNVLVDVDGPISTTGAGSIGIVAQSVAGHAGSGGGSTGIVAFAANGGSAGAGGNVTVTNGGAITTISDESIAIAAQSVGGGGGHGGDAFSDYYSSGGEGGQGGNGGAVTVNNSGTLNTSGAGAVGIMAYSVGGGGGSGGFAAGIAAFGGRGGGGGSGDTVTVVNSGTIVTGSPTELPIMDSADPGCGDDGGCAHGILAQSIGGGGGSGGSAFGWFSVGGVAAGSNHGDGGGAGGQVFVNNSGIIFTQYDNSTAILAQSVGGGGGHGGGAGSIGAIASVSVGASGGNGGAGNIVSVVHNDNSVTTTGDYSHGIHAQSIGGGGGHGGYAVSASFGVDTPSVSAAVGGSGGTGGSANSVSVCTLGLDGTGFCSQPNGNAITTSGENAYGILAQSVGGGGGHGGFSIAFTGGEDGSASMAIGGAGGGGGAGLDVFVGSASAITTFGDHATALAAQSIGGGGGSGGFALSGALALDGDGLAFAMGGKGASGGAADTVMVESTGPIVTHGVHSQGIVAQSIAGGGGNGGASIAATISASSSTQIAVAIGGTGGTGADADAVTVSSSGSVTTSGDHAQAILAQSIGGGGGNGGMSLTGNLSTSQSTQIGVSIGGAGGNGGKSGTVEVDSTAPIATAGLLADGIVAQAIGGAGGNGGWTMSANASTEESTAIGVSVAGSGGTGATGGAVTVTNGDGVTVTGGGARGIVAQSIGGGGGNGGMAISGSFSTSDDTKQINVAIGGAGGSGSTGGAVTVTNSGVLATGGASGNSGYLGEHAILAQSIGGSGGSGGLAVTGTTNNGARTAAIAVGGTGGSGANADTVIVGNSAALMTTSSESHGIYAQSIGGGGGHGGATASFDTMSSDSQTESFAVTVGGSGGIAGAGETVTVTNDTAQITVSGAGSMGIVAQSIGGGGGHGGGNFFGTQSGTTTSNSAANKLTVGIGGSGGAGGNGGAVNVFNNNSGATDAAEIMTGSGAGNESVSSTAQGHAIFAQSVGGGGGSGGVGIQGNVTSQDDSGKSSLAVGVGGAGGAGGTGGAVNVQNHSVLHTLDDNSYGILAQSIGGGGGNGATGILGKVKNTGDKSLVVGIGADGGAGGDGGSVTVATFHGITVSGDGSKAIMAQSVGGGGGNGGVGIDGDITDESSSSNSATQVSFGLGGSASTAGAGGSVDVTVHSGITVATGIGADGTGSQFAQMDAVFAQSVGGGGGNGALGVSGDISNDAGDSQDNKPKALTMALGGSGGAGGDGGTVTVTINSATLTTVGDSSRGVVAQSIGGGGGNGAAGLAGTVTGSAKRTVTFSLGAAGGSGGKGEMVTVDNSGSIVTGVAGQPLWYTQQHGILAQSIGGGGGMGATTGSLLFGSSSSDPDGTEHGIAMTLGGASSGGVGGTVQVTNNAGSAITTLGNFSHGVFAQSIGGGGGAGGDLGGIGAADKWAVDLSIGASGGAGDGGTVTVTNSANIMTSGLGSHAIFAQSIGGGGGDAGHGAGLAMTGNAQQTTANAIIGINIGGAGTSTSGDGMEVDIEHQAGSLMTSNYGAAGIMAQSIGGGGGTAGVGVSGADGSVFTMGGTDNVQGDGGEVVVNFMGGGQIVTGVADNDQVVAAYGIFAQSVGGGGGLGGLVLFGGDANFGSGLAMGNGTETSGNGGNVQLTIDADITARGNSSVGIFAQSVAGGGGVKGDLALAPAAALVGSAGGAGDAGSVTVQYDGTLTTTGANAHGIFAQSAAGTGSAAPVMVDVSGTVQVSGSNAHGVFATATGGAGNSSITVTIDEGASVAATGDDGYAVYLLGGTGKEVENHGTLGRSDNIAEGLMLRAGNATGGGAGGNTTIDNFGTANGQIAIHVDNGFFNNQEGGLFNSGSSLDLGDDGVLSNSGRLAPGGFGAILTTDMVKGRLTQASTGSYAVDIDTAADLADLLEVAGSASLEGQVLVNVIDVGDPTGSFIILGAAGGVASSTHSDLTVVSTATAAYSLSYPNSSDIVLDYSIDFTNDAVVGAANDNQRSVTQHIQDIFELRALDDILKGLVNIVDLDDYLDALDSLTPQILSDNQRMALLSNLQFSDAMLSCAAQTGTYRFVSEEQCGWIRFGGTKFQRDSTSHNRAFDQTAWQVAGGGQLALGDDWWLGGALGVDFQHLEVEDNLAESDGVLFQAGMVAKKSFGNTMLAASFSGGYGSYDITRHLFSGHDPESTENLWLIAGQLSAAHSFTIGEDFYIKPRVDFGVTHVVMNGLSESGAGGASLEVERNAETYFDVQPAVEIGGEFTAGGVLLRPSFTIGITQFLGDASPSVTAAFDSAPLTVDPFTIESELDKTYLDLEAAVDIFAADNLVVSVEGFGQLSHNTSSYGGGLKLAISF